MGTYLEKMKLVRDLAAEYIDIELQLDNQYLDDKTRHVLYIRQEQIVDTLREFDF